MDYQLLWELMADLMNKIEKAGGVIPAHVMIDLRSAKTTIELLKLKLSPPETVIRLEEYFANLESFIVPSAKTHLGEKYVLEWLTKVADAQRRIPSKEKKKLSIFPVGIPRNKRWVRLEPSQELTTEDIRNLVDEMSLEFRIQNNGHIVVFGKEKAVKNFVKKMAQIMRDTNKKTQHNHLK